MTPEHETGIDGLTIRPFRSGDEEALLMLNVYGLHAAGIPVAEDYYAGKDFSGLEQTYSEKVGGLMLVGEADRKVAAMGGIRCVDDNTCEVLRMRVYPEYQGRGYGRAILELLECEARRLGYQQATLITGENQHPAIDLYTRYGYDITHREVLIGIPSVHMRKNLNAPWPRQAGHAATP